MQNEDVGPAQEAYLRRWNWGAALGGWMWGLGHGMPLTLLGLLPGVNVIVTVLLGMYGSRWAWARGGWDSFEAFQAAQARWARNGAIFFVVCGLATAAYYWRR